MIIPLTQGQVTHVSPEDYEFLTQWKWHVLKTRGKFYALRGFDNAYMHRVIADRCGLDMTYQIDHRDGDGLNNRRFNLRSATNAQNLQNRGKQRNNTSGVKGVTWDKVRRKWKAEIQADGKRKFLGRFDIKALAAIAYQNAAQDLHKEFA